MTQPIEINAIRGLIRRARRRIRVQAALDGAALASVVASAIALTAVYGVRSDRIASTTGIAILIGAGVAIAVAAAIAAARRLEDERIARRIDRASNLSDRLSTAVAFQRELATRARYANDELSQAMMRAAIRDGILAAPRADVRAAAPIAWPRHGRTAAAFLLVSAVTAGLRLSPQRPDAGDAAAPERVASRTTEPPDRGIVALDADEKAYIQAIVEELKTVAERDRVPELNEFAARVEQLVAKADAGEITKQALLEQLAQAEEALRAATEPNPDEIRTQLQAIGKTLARDSLTAKLGEALQKQELANAEQQLKQLADTVADNKLPAQEKRRLRDQLANVAKQMADQQRAQQTTQLEREQKLTSEIRRLEDQQRNAKDERQRREVERRLADAQRELQKLRKDEQEKQQSEQRRALQRLQKDVEQAADHLEKSDSQAAENLKNAARETGRVDRDQRKQAAQKKLASQMDDLREAMRRAKQKSNKGPTDPFNKNGKNQDFIARARGQRGGSGQVWKPGQSHSQAAGQSGNGSGQGSGSASWGDQHDENLTGDATAMTGKTKDQDLQGAVGRNGGSTRETILAAAQKGFAGVSYKNVYANYERIVEEVMRNEKLPSSYKYYVKRYFAKIHPNIAAASGETESAQP